MATFHNLFGKIAFKFITLWMLFLFAARRLEELKERKREVVS